MEFQAVNSTKQCFPNLGDDENPLERFIKTADPSPADSDSRGLGWGPELWSLNKLPRGLWPGKFGQQHHKTNLLATKKPGYLVRLIWALVHCQFIIWRHTTKSIEEPLHPFWGGHAHGPGVELEPRQWQYWILNLLSPPRNYFQSLFWRRVYYCTIYILNTNWECLCSYVFYWDDVVEETWHSVGKGVILCLPLMSSMPFIRLAPWA